MSEKTTKVKRIMELLADKEMTSLELAPLLGITSGNCSYKLNVLYNDKRIRRVKGKKPYKYKIALTPKELLKRLYDIMDNRMKKKEVLTAEEMEYLIEIEEVLKID
ncbi:hypothetical protein LCGC14_0540330 [marine sediment metagenome]|uniref:Uncharacterized protein n=1 Tax=marine sediment metagenome TaxID=412755 RepID=A0A0F9UEG7_9ZZZZ